MSSFPRRFTANVLEAIREFSRWQDGAMVLEEDGILIASGGTEFPVGFQNCVVRTDPAVNADLVLDRAEEFFSQIERGYTVWVNAPTDSDVEQLLQSRGQTPHSSAPWLVLRERPKSSRQVGKHTLRLTSDAADLPKIGAVLGSAFEVTGTPVEETTRLFVHPTRVFTPDTVFAIAEVDDQPAAVAMALFSGGIAGVYWVGTHPSYARLGLGTACTAAVVNAAFDRGVTEVGLHPTTMGAKVYERMGFVPDAEGHRWYVSYGRGGAEDAPGIAR